MGTIATGLQAVQQQKSKKCPYQTKRSGESTDEDYEDYETARKYNKRALDTSNVETQSEGESKKRKQLVPSRFLSDIEIDSEGECVPSPPKKHQFINVKHR